MLFPIGTSAFCINLKFKKEHSISNKSEDPRFQLLIHIDRISLHGLAISQADIHLAAVLYTINRPLDPLNPDGFTTTSGGDTVHPSPLTYTITTSVDINIQIQLYFTTGFYIQWEIYVYDYIPHVGTSSPILIVEHTITGPVYHYISVSGPILEGIGEYHRKGEVWADFHFHIDTVQPPRVQSISSPEGASFSGQPYHIQINLKNLLSSTYTGTVFLIENSSIIQSLSYSIAPDSYQIVEFTVNHTVSQTTLYNYTVKVQNSDGYYFYTPILYTLVPVFPLKFGARPEIGAIWYLRYDEFVPDQLNFNEFYDINVALIGADDYNFTANLVIYEKRDGNLIGPPVSEALISDVPILNNSATVISWKFLKNWTGSVVNDNFFDYDEWTWFDTSSYSAFYVNSSYEYTVNITSLIRQDSMMFTPPPGKNVSLNMFVQQYKQDFLDLAKESNDLAIQIDQTSQSKGMLGNWLALFGVILDLIGLGIGGVPGWVIEAIGWAMEIYGLYLISEEITALLQADDLRKIRDFAIEVSKDPPDEDYESVVEVQPVNISLPEPENYLENITYILTYNLANLTTFLEALKISYERFHGAYIDNETTYKNLQAEAIKNFSKAVITNIITLNESFSLASITAYNYSFISEFFNLTSISQAALNNISDYVSREGLPENATQELIARGYNESQIEEFELSLININETMDGIYEDSEYITQMARKSSEMFQNQSSELVNDIENMIQTVEERVENPIVGNVSSLYYVNPSSTEIVPGESKNFIIEIFNLNPEFDTFYIELDNIRSDWVVNISDTSVSIAPTHSAIINLSIIIPRIYNEEPGLQIVKISIISALLDNFSFPAQIRIKILPFYDCEIMIDPLSQTIFDYAVGEYNIEIQNIGNVEDFYTLNISDMMIGEGVFSQDQLFLLPGETRIETLTIEVIELGCEAFTINLTSLEVSTSVNGEITIIDDDITPPIISNLEVSDDMFKVNISFDAIDDNSGDDQGIEILDIFIDDQLLISYRPTPTETNFYFELSNDWVMDYEIHEIVVTVWDADNDRPNDSLAFTLSETFETIVEEMVNYVLWEIDDLQDEVDERFCFLFDWIIINRLDAAECLVNGALDAYLEGRIPLSIILDKFAKANVELSDVITIILDWIGFISEEDGDYISNYLHNIRDHITSIMGAMVGTEESMKIANIETEIEQLRDQIFNNYSLYISLSIDFFLWTASENLDLALFWMVEEYTELVEAHLILAESELECAKDVITQYRDNGDIPENEAQMLITMIDGFITELTTLHS